MCIANTPPCPLIKGFTQICDRISDYSLLIRFINIEVKWLYIKYLSEISILTKMTIITKLTNKRNHLTSEGKINMFPLE